VEHEEVLLVPRYVKCNRVTFKYGLGDEFIGILKTLHMLGLDNKEPIKVKNVEVAPRDVVAACLPDPAHLGHLMEGSTCAGTWIKGKKDGKEKQVYLYQVADNKESMKKFDCQVVVTQTAFNAVIGMELLDTGVWKKTGVEGPEAFDPVPFMNLMGDFGFPWGIKEW
jgi:saccharopine dehydrogenase-like NADP-dependent oxidoreductase